ncbi:MAG: hypothetical protein M3450_07040 [Actinomycetota bacterium]|nr:hypothetical protein [Actinomycetota bacterium]MDQ3692776.1 hypothetical protein [Chloroflexota bacterium]
MVEVVASVMARGGVLRVVDGKLACRLPPGDSLPAELAAAITAHKEAILGAFGIADWEATVRNIMEMTGAERAAYRAALAHDLTALAAAERRLARRKREERGNHE